MNELKVEGVIRRNRRNSILNGIPSIIRTYIELELIVSQVCIFHAEGLKVTSRKSTTAEQRITLLYLLCARAYANDSNHIRRTSDGVVAAVHGYPPLVDPPFCTSSLLTICFLMENVHS